MIRKFARRPSPATVIASLALFVSLSGVSYGVATGFIDSREIRNETIVSKDIRNSTCEPRICATTRSGAATFATAPSPDEMWR